MFQDHNSDSNVKTRILKCEAVPMPTQHSILLGRSEHVEELLLGSDRKTTFTRRQLVNQIVTWPIFRLLSEEAQKKIKDAAEGTQN